MLRMAIVATALLFPAIAQAKTSCVTASWYGPGFHNRMTANGEKYNQFGISAAHKTMRFGTKVKLTNRKNGKSVVVRINDRGPYIKGRSFDLSRHAAYRIGMLEDGKACVKVEIVK